MSRPPATLAITPALMRSETAAAYVDEKSIEAFRRRVPIIYPEPILIEGRGKVWRKEDLDDAVARLARQTAKIRDGADVL